MNKYGFIRVGACAPELKVANTAFNAGKIIEQIEDAQEKGIKVIAFPELALCGATCADLFFQDVLLKQCLSALKMVLKATADADMVVVLGLPLATNGRLFNTAVVISKGVILGAVPKTYINPLENKWFCDSSKAQENEVEILGQKVPFGVDLLFKYDQLSFGVEIGDDLLALYPPSNNYLASGANLIVNISADNDCLSKREDRRKYIACQSDKGYCGYIYASAGAGESSSDLLFSGHLIIAENGKLLKDCPNPSFSNKLALCDIDIERLNAQKLQAHNKIQPAWQLRKVAFKLQNHCDNIVREYSKTPFIPDKDSYDKDCEAILNMQAHALAKRLLHLDKPNVLIGVSGGLDSTLALLVCDRAYKILGEKATKIVAVTMPGFGTSGHTYKSSVKLIEAIGATFMQIDITKAVQGHLKDIGHNMQDGDITYENAQVRERTQVLMDLANQLGGIVVGTSSLSEIALGWTTYAGDQMSMYQVNCSIPKTLVKELIIYTLEKAEQPLATVLQTILATPISPELLPTDKQGAILQKTEDILGDYILHDFFLYHFLIYGAKPNKLLALAQHTFSNDYEKAVIKSTLNRFISRFLGNQFKRNSMPDGANIGDISLSPRGYWRMPSDTEGDIWIKDIE